MSELEEDEYERDKRIAAARAAKKSGTKSTGGAQRMRTLDVYAKKRSPAKPVASSAEDERVNQWRLQLAEEQRAEEAEEERLRAEYQASLRAADAAGARSPSKSPLRSSPRSVGGGSVLDGFGPASPAGFPAGSPSGGVAGQRFEGEFDWGDQGKMVESARLQQENAELSVALGQRESEVRRLETLISAMQPIPGLDPNSLLDVLVNGERQEHDIRDLKIVELAKKVRKMKAALQRERATATALRHEVQNVHLAADIAAVERGESAANVTAAREANAVFGAGERSPSFRARTKKVAAAAEASAEAAQAKKKRRPRASKEDEYRSKLLAAQGEVKRTQRALAKELGPDVAVADAVAAANSDVDVVGGWRGRAQTITMLRTKLKHMKRKLQQAAAGGKSGGSGFKSGAGSGDVDHQAMDDLDSMQRARDGAVEQLTEQFGALSTELASATEKLKHKKARIKTLEESTRRSKAQMKTMLKKSVNDDGLIERLTKDAVAFRDAAHDSRKKGERILLLEKAKQSAEDRSRRAENSLEECTRKLNAASAAQEHLRGEVGAAALQQAHAAQASRAGQAVAVRVLQVRVGGCRVSIDLGRKCASERRQGAVSLRSYTPPSSLSLSLSLAPARRARTRDSAIFLTRWAASSSGRANASRRSKRKCASTISSSRNRCLGRKGERRP
jgi:hypothetical protein